MMARKVFFLAVLTVSFLANGTSAGRAIQAGEKLFQEPNGDLKLIYGRNEGEVHLGKNLTPELLSSAKFEQITDGLRVSFGVNTHLEVTTAGECSLVTWTSSELPLIQDCIDYGQAHWYGGFEQKDQRWPMEKLVLTDYEYVTKELDNMGVAERYFLNSFGDYIYVEEYVPLFIDANATGQSDLCFSAKFQQPFLPVPDLRLHYRVCSLTHPRLAQLHAIDNIFGVPTALPDQRMIEFPIFSTWVRYKRDINQTIVLNFANEIVEKGYSFSQFEIDDDWETCYGELEFNLEKFPDPAGMVTTLISMGFRVTLWIHPFMNENCPSFDAAKAAGYFVTDEQGNTKTTWWNGLAAAIVDFTNPAATDWFLNKVRAIKDLTQLDSFKFDAGESSWMPKPRILNAPNDQQPNIYTSNYVNSLAEFGPLTEVRVGFGTQDVPLFVRMVDKDSRWGMNNGLRSIVTTLLAMNLAGYPYVLPDMIGGNNYFGEEVSKELFVRWLQASTFMPSLQFSFVPWDFQDPEIEEICLHFVHLHGNYSQTFMDLATNYMAQNGSVSINNPIWMASDDFDEVAFTIDDEYLLGTTILVAPVMDEGAVTRDIYLPAGLWRDMNTGQIYNGKSWLWAYPAPLDTLPYFEIAVFNGAVSLASSISAFFLSLIIVLLMK